MAKELVFKLSGTDYLASPVKLERKKIYGTLSGKSLMVRIIKQSVIE